MLHVIFLFFLIVLSVSGIKFFNDKIDRNILDEKFIFYLILFLLITYLIIYIIDILLLNEKNSFTNVKLNTNKLSKEEKEKLCKMEGLIIRTKRCGFDKKINDAYNTCMSEFVNTNKCSCKNIFLNDFYFNEIKYIDNEIKNSTNYKENIKAGEQRVQKIVNEEIAEIINKNSNMDVSKKIDDLLSDLKLKLGYNMFNKQNKQIVNENKGEEKIRLEKKIEEYIKLLTDEKLKEEKDYYYNLEKEDIILSQSFKERIKNIYGKNENNTDFKVFTYERFRIYDKVIYGSRNNFKSKLFNINTNSSVIDNALKNNKFEDTETICTAIVNYEAVNSQQKIKCNIEAIKLIMNDGDECTEKAPFDNCAGKEKYLNSNPNKLTTQEIEKLIERKLGKDSEGNLNINQFKNKNT